MPDSRHWRKKLAKACRKGLHYPEESVPDAGLFIGALQEVHPYGEEKLGTNWKKFAEMQPFFADLVRLAARRFKFQNNSQLHLDFPPIHASSQIGRRMKVSLEAHNEQTSQSVQSHVAPSTQPQLILHAEDIQPTVQNQPVVTKAATPSRPYPPRRITVTPEPRMRTNLESEEYAELVKRLWNGEGTKEEITACILQESHEKALEDFRERRDHPERWEERQRQKRAQLRRENKELEQRRRERSREHRRVRRRLRRERRERRERSEFQ
ncbi:hypothetical protein GGI35DRAFT_458090 [Trichoderma velutinum]